MTTSQWIAVVGGVAGVVIATLFGVIPWYVALGLVGLIAWGLIHGTGPIV